MVKLLAKAMSTPTEDRTRVRVELDYAKLAKYEVNVRSFHPNKQFEPGGFRFHGDNRGFSLGESYFGKKNSPSACTSRIWQCYNLRMDLKATGVLDEDKDTDLKQESNPSAPGPDAWSIFGKEEPYEQKEYKPQGTLIATNVNVPHGGQKEVAVRSWYGGENHAFITSRTFQKTGWTPVPTLDVHAELYVKVERIALYMDILSLVYGDGFPNSEAFIKDNAGNKVFLGTHVRIGVPATHLAGDQKRLMWANAIRVAIDPDGNFGEQLWVFGQVLGGPPDLRDEYVTLGDAEVCAPVPKPRYASSMNAFDKQRGKFIWDCGDFDQIVQPGKAGKTDKPLHLSAFTPLEVVRGLMQQVWITGPTQKITRSQWNDYHLHRNPNDGRSPDDYDVSPDKWKK